MLSGSFRIAFVRTLGKRRNRCISHSRAKYIPRTLPLYLSYQQSMMGRRATSAVALLSACLHLTATVCHTVLPLVPSMLLTLHPDFCICRSLHTYCLHLLHDQPVHSTNSIVRVETGLRYALASLVGVCEALAAHTHLVHPAAVMLS